MPSDSNMGKKEHEKLEKYNGLQEEREKTLEVKATMEPVVTGAPSAVNPKLWEELRQIPGITSELSVHNLSKMFNKKLVMVDDFPSCLFPTVVHMKFDINRWVGMLLYTIILLQQVVLRTTELFKLMLCSC